jgi:hypothetical protein
VTPDAYYAIIVGAFIFILICFWEFEKDLWLGLLVAGVVSTGIGCVVRDVWGWYQGFLFPWGAVRTVLSWILLGLAALLVVWAFTWIKARYDEKEIDNFGIGNWVDNNSITREKIPRRFRSTFYSDGKPKRLYHATSTENASDILTNQRILCGGSGGFYMSDDFDYAWRHVNGEGLGMVVAISRNADIKLDCPKEYHMDLPVAQGKYYRPRDLKFISTINPIDLGYDI